MQESEVRIDKWLWAVRVFRTRTLAAKACAAGKVKIGDQPLKASRNVKVGDIISANNGTLTRTLKVAGLLERRVGASVVPQYAEELTPPEEFARARENKTPVGPVRTKGTGRPTKKERRQLFRFHPWEE